MRNYYLIPRNLAKQQSKYYANYNYAYINLRNLRICLYVKGV